MSDFLVEILPEAEAEAREAFLWYSKRSTIAAEAFRAELIKAIDGLSMHPMMWPADADGIRLQLLRHLPYTLHYEVRDQTVTVLAVAHQRRRPGYWLDR